MLCINFELIPILNLDFLIKIFKVAQKLVLGQVLTKKVRSIIFVILPDTLQIHVRYIHVH